MNFSGARDKEETNLYSIHIVKHGLNLLSTKKLLNRCLASMSNEFSTLKEQVSDHLNSMDALVLLFSVSDVYSLS